MIGLRIGSALADLQLGDHICMPVTSVAERRSIVAGLVDDGLRDRHQVLVLTDDPPPHELSSWLAGRKPEADRALACGQIQVLPSEASYLPDGTLDVDRTLAAFNVHIDLAQRQGYHGIRVSGDLTWIRDGRPSDDTLIDYETRVNTLFVDGPVIGLCLYDPRSFDPVAWDSLTAAHPCTAWAADSVSSPRLRCRRTDDPPGLKLAGEADWANHQALPSLLTAATNVPGRCWIDATELAFADARAVASLLHTAAERGKRPTTIVGSTQLVAMLSALTGGAATRAITLTTSTPD